MQNLFLSIDGFEIPDLMAGDYTCYEKDLSITARMISGRLVEEVAGKIWVIQLNHDAIGWETMAELNQRLQAKRQHEIFFLPSTGGKELLQGTFAVSALPAPTLTRWTDEEEGPVWAGYGLTFEEVTPHA